MADQAAPNQPQPPPHPHPHPRPHPRPHQAAPGRSSAAAAGPGKPDLLRSLPDVGPGKGFENAVRYLRRERACCAICCLRMLNIPGKTLAEKDTIALESFVESIQSLGKNDEIKTKREKMAKEICPLCWGVFDRAAPQNSNGKQQTLATEEEERESVKACKADKNPRFLSIVHSRVLSEGYEFKEFKPSFGIPSTLDVRDKSMYLDLWNKFPEKFPCIPQSEMVPLKPAHHRRDRKKKKRKLEDSRVAYQEGGDTHRASPEESKESRSDRRPPRTWDEHYYTYLKEVLSEMTRLRLPSLLGNATQSTDSLFKIHIELKQPKIEEADRGALTNVMTNVTRRLMQASDEYSDYNRGRIGKRRGKNPFSRQNLPNILGQLTHGDLSQSGFCPPPVPSEMESISVEVVCSHNSMYVSGRYLKLVRGISQTPWILENNERKSPTSVQEEIGRYIEKEFKAKAVKLHSGGREDADVRMLGNGRPFVLEIVDPHRQASEKELLEMVKKVNGHKPKPLVLVKEARLHKTSEGKTRVTELMDAAQNKRKEYRARVYMTTDQDENDVRSKLNAVKDLKVLQKTPIRVLHRRSQLIRPKMIHRLKIGKWHGPRLFDLDLVTEAGTYVKEFVHGDRGRTRPHLGDLLGCQTDILILDVIRLLPNSDPA